MLSKTNAQAIGRLASLVFAVALLIASQHAQAADPNESLGDAIEALVDGDYQKARELAQPQAESGDLLAIRLMGLIERKQEQERQEAIANVLERGKDLFASQYYDRAFETFQPLGEAGNAEALMYMGLVKKRKISEEPEAALAALPYLEKAAAKGLPWAQYLAAMAYHVMNTPGSRSKGDSWMIEAAHGSVAEAYWLVSLIYCREKDRELADAWMLITSSDAGFRASAQALDEHWEEIKTDWEDRRCNRQQPVTKDYVREIHQRAQDLIDTYDLRVCRGVYECFNRKMPGYL
jgi:TPR repeat protein